MTLEEQIKQAEADIHQVKTVLYRHYVWLWNHISMWATLQTAENHGLEYPLEFHPKKGKRKIYNSAKELEHFVPRLSLNTTHSVIRFCEGKINLQELEEVLREQ